MLKELHPMRNWKGWAVALVMAFLFALIEAVDSPADHAAYLAAARKIQQQEYIQ